MDAALPQHPPDLVGVDVAEVLGHQTPVPAGITLGAWSIQGRQHPRLGLGIILAQLPRSG